MDIAAYELAQSIRDALVFGDAVGALVFADALVELHEKAAEAEFQDWVARHPETSTADAEKGAVR
jgi:hypothetical protein